MKIEPCENFPLYGILFLFFFAGEIPFYAAACLSLVCECIRMVTDNNSQMSLLAVRTGFVYTVLRGLNLLANNTGYNKVSA